MHEEKETLPNGHLLCGGLGYCATALHEQVAKQGWKTSATLRDAKRADFYRDIGVAPISLSSPDLVPQGITHILLSAPPLETGDDPLFQFIEAFLRSSEHHVSWIGYLSTTGVYGDRDGDWVDEETPPQPTSDRGRRRLAAETQWRALGDGMGIPVHIFRLPGIYGPGRSAIDSLRDGTARRIVKQGQVFSRIHRDDIVQTLFASMQQPRAGRIYNVCDDEPAPPHDVVTYGAELLGISPPPLVNYEDVELSPMAQSFYAENKRVSNRRIKDELGVNLKYPTYREGLRACLSQ